MLAYILKLHRYDIRYVAWLSKPMGTQTHLDYMVKFQAS